MVPYLLSLFLFLFLLFEDVLVSPWSCLGEMMCGEGEIRGYIMRDDDDVFFNINKTCNFVLYR